MASMQTAVVSLLLCSLSTTLAGNTVQQTAPSLSSSLPTLQSPIFPRASSTDLPRLGEQCTSRCNDEAIAGSLHCKHTIPIRITSNGEIMGTCRLNTGFSGCTTDDDCYSFNDICNSGVCTPRTLTSPRPSQPNPSVPSSNTDHTANGMDIASQSQGIGTATGTNSHHLPMAAAVAAAAVNNHENQVGEDQVVEVKGGAVGRSLRIPISTQAQILIALFAALAICGTVIKCVMVIRQHKHGNHVKKPSRADMTGYGVEVNVDWRMKPDRQQRGKSDVDSLMEMRPISDRDYEPDPYSSTEEFMLE